jgi:hypothetical protein
MTMNKAAIAIGIGLMTGFTGCKGGGTVGQGESRETRTFAAFGEAPKGGDVPVVPADTLLADAGAYDGKYLRVTGTVSSVCVKKGCWLAFGQETRPLLVKFTCPIEGRLIPGEAVGKEAMVEGTVKVVEVSEAEARHIKEDAGAAAEEIARIVGPQQRVTIAAPSAKVYGLAASQGEVK